MIVQMRIETDSPTRSTYRLSVRLIGANASCLLPYIVGLDTAGVLPFTAKHRAGHDHNGKKANT
jgi:hypothetical protein